MLFLLMAPPKISSDARMTYVIEQYRVRLPAFENELLWAAEKPIPADFVPPPAWVKMAIRRIGRETGLPLEIVGLLDSPTPSQLGMQSGLVSTVTAALKTPTEAEKREEERDPHLGQLRKMFAASLNTSLPNLTEDTAEPAPPARPKTAREFESFLRVPMKQLDS
jgi:hypothetical protein